MFHENVRIRVHITGPFVRSTGKVLHLTAIVTILMLGQEIGVKSGLETVKRFV